MNLESYLVPGAIIVGPWKESELGEHETCEIASMNDYGEVQTLVVTVYPAHTEHERIAEIMWGIKELQDWNNS